MKPEQIKEIVRGASDRLVVSLSAGQSEALTQYLKAVARFHR